MTPLAPDPRTVCHFKLPFTKGWGSRGKRYGIPPGVRTFEGYRSTQTVVCVDE
jgi:hypothetical protein